MNLTTMVRLLVAIGLGVWGLEGGIAQAGGDSFQLDVFRTTISIPYVALETNAQGAKVLVNRRLTNRHVVNLGQGRDPEAPVPKNEILVIVNPDNYLFESNARFAIFDKTTNSVIKNLTRVSQSVSGYGDHSDYFLFASGSLLDDLASPSFTIGVTSLSGTARGREKETSKGTKLKAKTASVVGEMPLTINGVAVPAVVLKGKVRVFGSPIFSFAP